MKVSLSSFADRNASLRLTKARPIAELFRRYAEVRPGSGQKLLDIGAGAGIIGTAVAQDLGAGYILMDTNSDAIDDCSHFMIASGEFLPLASGSFDFIIANHVIEHVNSQPDFLKEIHRVLSPTGVAYMATPSKYALLEPHYKLPLLSWMPRLVANAVVRATRKDDAFNVSPLRRRDIRKIARGAGLYSKDLTVETIGLHARFGRRRSVARAVTLMPGLMLKAMSPVVPTHVWALSHRPIE
jgi:2-polyprenyl-3-methyl-5-hydroxy-6-metoxy-1,4-benzoquinol methylase